MCRSFKPYVEFVILLYAFDRGACVNGFILDNGFRKVLKYLEEQNIVDALANPSQFPEFRGPCVGN
jgi:hypothetical protein